MLHLEDLNIEKFIWCIENLSEFHVTEKIDGSELIFGLDDHGKFYTSREAKSGKRFYSESQWPKQFWTTGFRGAHKVLENNQHILKLLMNPGDSIEIEVLYGPTPNTVPYNADGYNRIVFLRPISGEVDIKKLNDKINSCILRGIKVDIENVPHTENGWDYTLDNIAEQHWKFKCTPSISLENYSKKEITKTLNELFNFLNKKSLLEKTNLETAKQRITKNNRDIIEQTRNTLLQFKLKIKENLIKNLVDNRSSTFGPSLENGGWIEGLVFLEPKTNFQFKLINKEKFTHINEKNHYLQHYLRENYWKKFKENLYTICNLTKEDNKQQRVFFEDYKDLANRNFGKDFNELRSQIQKECWNYMDLIQKEYQTLPFKKEHINESNCQKIFEEFSGTRARFTQMISKAFTATQPEHLIELVMTEDIQADHRKHFHEDARRIHKHEIKKTLEYVSKITGIKYSILNESMLGSTGKVPTSGDIDICIDSSNIKCEKLIERIKKYLPEKYIYNSKGLDIIHIICPIEGDTNNGNVQVDLMLSEHPEWHKFYHDCDLENTKYKGLYRNALLRAMTVSTNLTRTAPTSTINETGELIGRVGYVLVPSRGIEYQMKERSPSKNGGYTKSFKVTERRHYSSNPQKILDNVIFLENRVLGNPKIETKDIRTFENLLALARKHRSEDIALIEEITRKIIKELKYKLPEELTRVI